MRYIIFLLFVGCFSNEEFTTEKCNQLSMATFRGSPKAAHKFKQNCSNEKIVYTKEHCQKALNQFILGKSIHTLEKNFGNEVSGCFTKYDIEKFARKDEKDLLMSKMKQ